MIRKQRTWFIIIFTGIFKTRALVCSYLHSTQVTVFYSVMSGYPYGNPGGGYPPSYGSGYPPGAVPPPLPNYGNNQSFAGFYGANPPNPYNPGSGYAPPPPPPGPVGFTPAYPAATPSINSIDREKTNLTSFRLWCSTTTDIVPWSICILRCLVSELINTS